MHACEVRRPLFGEESFFGARRVKVGAAAAPTARRSFSASSNARAKSPSLHRARTGQRCKAAVGPSPVLRLRGYDGLVDLGYGRVDHSRDEFADEAVHINGASADLPKSGWRSSRTCLVEYFYNIIPMKHKML